MKSLLYTILVSFASLVSSHAAYDVYLKFNGGSASSSITLGDSGDNEYNKAQGWFKLSDFSFGIENTVTVGSGGGGISSGRASFDEVKVTKSAGAGSAKLFLACATGSQYTSVTIVLVRPGATPEAAKTRILQMDYYHVVIQSVKTAGSDGDEILNEDVVFKHGSQRLQFFTQNSETGAEEPPWEAQWSVIENIAVAP
tara:strand:+ start:539 stop:1132 length:594 start_codon:yes stop_codon:yes gene_type:complete